jgi:hypothetical protein
MVESFWDIPAVGEVRTPIDVLREQADQLTQQTKGLLVGVTKTRALDLIHKLTDGTDLAISLEIQVPAMNNYEFSLLTYNQPVTAYPGRLVSRLQEDGVMINDEAMLVDTLKQILTSADTRRVIGSLLSQAANA